MSRLRFTLLLAATLLVPAAHADPIDACFNFLNAQDYPRALAESASLLKLKKLSREDERYTHLCRGQALANTTLITGFTAAVAAVYVNKGYSVGTSKVTPADKSSPDFTQ